MAGWSSLSSSIARNLLTKSKFTQGLQAPARTMGHRVMTITPSRWQWQKFKNLFHFYVMLGAIPCGLVIFCTNVFIGPAKLAEVPEGYTPKHWEYHKHPITRFLARYFFTSPQQEYEKYLHLLYEEDEKMKIRELTNKVMDLMAERADYKAYYYQPIDGKYIRRAAKEREEYSETSGIRLS